MKTIFHPANERGNANFGWLKANHSFSFGSWYNPDKIHFGALRVLNDDTVAPGMGFSTHPHDNMEIITIPLSGGVMHRDSMGNGGVISAGEIQVMSAGTGISHSEMNASHSEELQLFQIWIFPREKNVAPRYDQRPINTAAMKNEFLQLLSPDPNDAGTWIHQDAWIHMAELDAGKSLEYELKSAENGVYSLVVEGNVEINKQIAHKRDAVGFYECEKVTFFANENSRVLVIEVPMNETAYA